VQIAINKQSSSDYLYYRIPNPWLQVKLIKVLQMFPLPEDKLLLSQIIDVMDKIIRRTDVTKSINKNNAEHGILFEAANLIFHYGSASPEYIQNNVLKLLDIFLKVNEPNLKS